MDKIQKLLNKINPKDANKIADVFERIKSGDIKKLDIKKLRGYPDIFRVRVGIYRVIYRVCDDNIRVIDLSKRDDNTYRNY